MVKDSLKIIVTTSDQYLHIPRIFAHLFNIFWDKNLQVEVVGYQKPPDLPPNFNFVSMGEQKIGDQKSFTRDLRKYIAEQPDYFIWSMEDGFLRDYVNFYRLDFLAELAKTRPDIGRVNLSKEVTKQDHKVYEVVNGITVYENNPDSLYRLSTQISIWSRDFAILNMQEDLTPWEFECQSDFARDKYHILGLDDDSPVRKNEGVRKHNLHAFNFDGISEDILNEMKTLKFI